MGVMDKFKNLVGVVDDDEIENEYVEPSEAETEQMQMWAITKRVAEVQKASEGIVRLCLCQEEI